MEGILLIRNIINWIFTIYFFLFVFSIIKVLFSFVYQKIKKSKFPTENDKATLILSLFLILFPAMMINGTMALIQSVLGPGPISGEMSHIIIILSTIIISGFLTFILGRKLKLSKRARKIFTIASIAFWLILVFIGIAIFTLVPFSLSF